MTAPAPVTAADVEAALAAARAAAAGTFTPNPRDREANAIRAALAVDRGRRAGLAYPDCLPAAPATELVAEIGYDEDAGAHRVAVWAHCGGDWWYVDAGGGWCRETDPGRHPHEADLCDLGTLGLPPDAAACDHPDVTGNRCEACGTPVAFVHSVVFGPGGTAARLPRPDELTPSDGEVAAARDAVPARGPAGAALAAQLRIAAPELVAAVEAADMAGLARACRRIRALCRAADGVGREASGRPAAGEDGGGS